DLAEQAVASVAGLNVDVTVLDETELAEQGFGGILGVGQGSDRPPRLVRLDYAPEGAVRHIALVGKGITFDTGGLSLKPANSMVGTKSDMGGAPPSLAALRPSRPSPCPCASPHGCAWPTTCPRVARPARVTYCACWMARPSRFSTPMPRGASCSGTAW